MKSSKGKVGRPTVMSKQVLSDLRKAYLIGCNDLEAASYAKISVGTIYKYQARNTEFLQQKETWKANPILLAKRTVYSNLKTSVETAKWYLERRSQEFKNKELEVNVNQEQTINSQLSEKQGKQILDKITLGMQAQLDYWKRKYKEEQSKNKGVCS